MKNYEVFSSRYYIAEHRVGAFRAKSDKEALEIFNERYCGNPNYRWDHLRIVEVVQERKERNLKFSFPEERRNR